MRTMAAAFSLRERVLGGETLLGAILDRSEEGGFQDARLHYLRVEVALQALRTAEALTRRDGLPPFRIPRELCASFEGRNPDLPPFDETTEPSTLKDSPRPDASKG